jgi:hypothetical protein
MEALHATATADGARVHFVSIGSAGPHGPAAEALAKKIFGAERTHFLGSLSPEQISAWMQRAEVGLSRSPQAIYEKSGSTAAMLEHGLDVRLLETAQPQSGKEALPVFPPTEAPSLETTTQYLLDSLNPKKLLIPRDPTL